MRGGRLALSGRRLRAAPPSMTWSIRDSRDSRRTNRGGGDGDRLSCWGMCDVTPRSWLSDCGENGRDHPGRESRLQVLRGHCAHGRDTDDGPVREAQDASAKGRVQQEAARIRTRDVSSPEGARSKGGRRRSSECPVFSAVPRRQDGGDMKIASGKAAASPSSGRLRASRSGSRSTRSPWRPADSSSRRTMTRTPRRWPRSSVTDRTAARATRATSRTAKSARTF